MASTTRQSESNRQGSEANSNKKSEPMFELFIDELRDMYSAERQLVRALPKVARATSSKELKQAIENHLEETKGHVDRLDKVFEALDTNPVKRGKKCEAMEGLIAEAQEMIEEGFEPQILDAALIAAAQKVEHYEIASYGTLCTWAELLGQNECLSELKATLGEEKKADELLSKLSDEINRGAMQFAKAS